MDGSADRRVKSVFCFTIAPEMQRKGVATQLLERVCKDAADEGFNFVEAYPNKVVTAESENHGGFATMYKKVALPCTWNWKVYTLCGSI
jgi:GNAT superfamily N-acetyltransferase